VTSKLKTKLHNKPVSWFIELQEDRMLNLSPGFQRKSVWTQSDRRKLICSLLDGYPVPSVFLYRRVDEHGHLMYDVLDGKQRLETILGFCRARGFKRRGFEVQYRFLDHPMWSDKAYWWRWQELDEYDQDRIWNYKLQVVEVDGEFDAIRDLFVRINSTGKKLTGQERRHAAYVNSQILEEAERVAKRLRKRLVADKVIRTPQIERMKDIELVAELLISFYHEGSINKKAAVDAAMSGGGFNSALLRKAGRDVASAYADASAILPDIKTTRFRNISEFYTLLMAIRSLKAQRRSLDNREDRQRAGVMLRRFSFKVTEAQENRRRLKGRMSITPVVRDYLFAVEQSADAKAQRNKREQIIRDVIGSLFEAQDVRRRFSKQQRELIWAGRANAKCPGTDTRRCGRVLDWDDFHIDHIKPWSKGGETDLSNAQILCASCNSSKGNRS
jgi:Restriction endonuclease